MDDTDSLHDATLRRRAFASAALSGLAGLAGCTGTVRPFVGKRETTTDAVTGVRSLVVAADVGDVTVTPNADLSAGAVRARLTKRSSSLLGSLSSVTLSLTATDGRAEAAVRTEDGVVSLGSPPAVRLRVEAHPSVVVAAARSANGDVVVERFDGPAVGTDAAAADPLRVESTNGDVTVRETGGDAVVRTTNGDATATGVGGFVRVQSVNGDARAHSCDGVLGVTSRNGDVEATVRALRSDADVGTTNGEARAELGASLSARVVAETTHGDMSVSATLDDSRLSDRRAVGTVGGGGPTLGVYSENGDVTVA
jgi:hypothetical protein